MKKTKKKEVVDLVGESSAPWKFLSVSSAYVFSRWSLRFHFFFFEHFIKKNKKNKQKQKLWSHCKRNQVLAFFLPELWLDLESFTF